MMWFATIFRVSCLTPEGAYIEVLVVKNCFQRKEHQAPVLKLDFKGAFDLDQVDTLYS